MAQWAVARHSQQSEMIGKNYCKTRRLQSVYATPGTFPIKLESEDRVLTGYLMLDNGSDMTLITFTHKWRSDCAGSASRQWDCQDPLGEL